jgi:DNA-binding CsgD family transcriptional regulator
VHRLVRAAAAGDMLLAPAVTRRLVERIVRHSSVGRDPGALEQLTEREREVLTLVATGLSNPEIADRLFIGEGTVKTHVSRILDKLELRERVQASSSRTSSAWSVRAWDRSSRPPESLENGRPGPPGGGIAGREPAGIMAAAVGGLWRLAKTRGQPWEAAPSSSVTCALLSPS